MYDKSNLTNCQQLFCIFATFFTAATLAEGTHVKSTLYLIQYNGIGNTHKSSL